MSSKNILVTTTDKIFNEGINNMRTKPNVAKQSITHTIATNKIETVNKTDKPQASKSKINEFIRNKSDKCGSLDKPRSLDKSGSTKGTETEDTVKINQDLFNQPVFLIKVPKNKNTKK